jgi:tetratricopeptide (TPR) repeat protein
MHKELLWDGFDTYRQPTQGSVIHLVCGLVSALALLVFTPCANAQDDDYQAIMAEGKKRFEASRFEEADALYKEAHRIEQNAQTLRGLGVSAYGMRDYARSLELLEKALLDQRRPLDKKQRLEVDILISHCRNLVAYLQITIIPQSGSLLVDGTEIKPESGRLYLNPGKHELRVRSEGYQEQSQTVHARGGDRTELTIELKRSPEKQPTEVNTENDPAELSVASSENEVASGGGKRLWTWITAGSAVAFSGTALYFWIDADKKYDDAQKQCGSTCPDSVVDPIDTADTLKNVFIGLSAAAAVGAVVLYFVEGQSENDTKEKNISLHVSPTAIQLGGRF